MQVEWGGVKLLTMENLGDYVELPNFVFDKLERGSMTYTHFSDILRMSLLAKYGGMWVDSTCWITKRVPEDVRNMSFWSCKTDNANIPLWSNSKWTSYALSSNRKNILIFSFVRDMLLEHVRKTDCYIDYLYQDYLLFFAYQNFYDSKCNILNLKESNLDRGRLWLLMNEKYDEDKYQKIIKDTWLFKLSYKTELNKRTGDGFDTFYGKMIKGEL